MKFQTVIVAYPGSIYVREDWNMAAMYGCVRGSYPSHNNRVSVFCGGHFSKPLLF